MNLKEFLQLPDNHFTVGQIFRWLWRALKGNRLQAILNASIGLMGVALSLASVWAMQRAIDIAAKGFAASTSADAANFELSTVNCELYWAVGVMAILILGEFALGISRVWVKNILGIKAQNRMQQQMLSRLLRSEWRGREAMHSGDIINRLEQDVRHVVSFLTETLPSTLSTIAMFIGAFVYLLQMDTWLAIVTVAILPLFILVSRYYILYMRRFTRKVRDCDSQVQSLLTETMQHRMLVKTMEANGQMLSRLEQTQSTLRGWVRRRTAFSVASNFFLNVGFSLGYLVAFLWGALRLSNGTITFGAMTAFLQLVYRIQGPARELTRLVPTFVGVFTATERLMELEDVPEEMQGEPQLLPAPCGIRFDHVTFNYGAPGQQPTMKDFSFNFPPGSCTAIVGETGAGKTTLIRLLLALVKPQEGEISLYSNVECRVDNSSSLECRVENSSSLECRVESLEFATAIPSAEGMAAANSTLYTLHSTLSPLHRCNFVYVPQGNTLLSGTLRENLLLGRLDATDEEMREALQLACADFVDELPDGLDTKFSEQGGGLSEGQAQRIAIARALLRPGSIMLLDEATSALDATTEEQVLSNILKQHSRTVIFVTHRPAVISYCDQILNIGS
jgi:ABC-type multidrug transport system fused ATPase/permease subunit